MAGIVGHVITAGMAEMCQNVAAVQPSHRDFRNHHFKERRERPEDALLSFFVTESCGRRKVAAFHDSTTNENFRMRSSHMIQSAAAFQVAVEHAHGGHSIDHWGHSFSVMMAGGETTGGIVVGESDKHGAYVKDRPVHPEDVAATVYHHLGIDGRRTTLKDRTGRPMHLVERGEVIRELYA